MMLSPSRIVPTAKCERSKWGFDPEDYLAKAVDCLLSQ